jgi:hypothetical protein
VLKEIDMQLDYAKQELPKIDKHVRNAAQLRHNSPGVPDKLVNCIDELEREAGQAAAMANDEKQEPQKIVKCVDHLEELGDRAMQACRQVWLMVKCSKRWKPCMAPFQS